jgi:hypothetical protein
MIEGEKKFKTFSRGILILKQSPEFEGKRRKTEERLLLVGKVFWYCCCRGVAGATRWASCSAKAKIQRGSCLFEEAVVFVACCFLAEISSSSSSPSR